MNETLNLCKQTLLVLSNMRVYYSTKISHDLNKTVTLLTMATIFLSVPTLIAAIYGMNIKLPYQDSSYIFASLMVLMFLVIGSFLIILRKTRFMK